MYYSLLIQDRNGVILNELTFERGSFTLGRVEGNDVVLNSATVSRRHARVFTDSGRCFVEDLNSSNGVLLDGQRIYGTAELTAGSQVRLGDYLLLLKARSTGASDQIQAISGARRAQGPVTRTRTRESLLYPRLVRVADALEGETFPLTDRENTVGRTEDNAIVLSDPSVSRHHAKVIVDEQRYLVLDVGSSNGTRVNDQLIVQPTLVEPGDVVRFGNVRFALAAPGQTVDLGEYGRYLAGSSRGLVVAVTLLALLLVLVASGIGIFLVLDERRQEPTPTPVVTGVSPAERARELKREGDILAASEQWNESIVKYELALNFDPEYNDAATALRHARGEFNASRIIQEADMNIHSADRLERQGSRGEAAQLYQRARDRLTAVPADSAYWRRAHDRVTMLIDPALVDIHRQTGIERAAAGAHVEAVDHFQRALDMLQALPEDRRADIAGDLRTQLWNELIAAGDAAFEAEDWPAAVGFYERAQGMGELRRETARRFEQARERLQ